MEESISDVDRRRFVTAEGRPLSSPKPIDVVPAHVDDVERIHEIINRYADRDEMLHRSHNELYENLRDYLVVKEEAIVAGCVSLHLNWKDLAELKALAVSQQYQRRGIGQALCRAVLAEAERMGVAVVYVLTARPVFFERLGFRQVSMAQLPRKVWGECFRCPKFNACYEVPLIYEVTPGAFDSVEGSQAPIELVPLWERPKR